MVISLALVSLLQAGTAPVRVLNAVVDLPTVVVQGGGQWGGIAYGVRTDYQNVSTGKQSFGVTSLRGERLANPVDVQFQPGYPHTVVLLGKATAAGNISAFVLRDSTAGKPSMSSFQMGFVNAMSDGTAVSVQINGKDLKRPKSLAVGEFSPMVNYSPREFVLVLNDVSGKELYRTTIVGRAGTRVTAIAMGARGLQGNRGPRLFTYDF